MLLMKLILFLSICAAIINQSADAAVEATKDVINNSDDSESLLMQQLEMLESDMKNKIKTLENRLNEKDQQIEMLENGLVENQQQIQELIHNNYRLESELSEVKKMRNENHLLKTEFKKEILINSNVIKSGIENEMNLIRNELKHDIKLINDTLKIQQETNSGRFTNIEEVLTRNEVQINKLSTFVSFTAYATEPRDYNADDVVLFDGIITNYGNFYNSSSSIFTCPYPGYYLFSANVRADSRRIMNYAITIDNTHIASAIARDEDTYDHASVTVVEFCDKMQQVWIRSRNDNYRMDGDGARFSTFTGTLLRID